MRNPESFEPIYDKKEQYRRIGESASIAEKERKARLEQLANNERAKDTIANFAKKLAATAAVTVAIASAVVACGHTAPEIMDTEQAKNVYEFQVESVTIHDGPNLRKDPRVVDGEDSNVLIDLGDEGQIVNPSYQGVVYSYSNENDANGAWVGFPADEFADSLREESLINNRAANKIKKREGQNKGDGIVWINRDYVDFERAEEF